VQYREDDMTQAQRNRSIDLDEVEMGVGTWSWGGKLIWGYGRGYTEADVKAAFEVSLARGIRLFDTAELYGWGRSERLLGQFLGSREHPALVVAKFFPYPWRLGRQSLRTALHHSLERMGLQRVDLYLIHQPFPPVPIVTWMDALADAVEAGLALTVGVSNYDVAQRRHAHEALARRGIVLTANQVEYSLLHRAPERNGLFEEARAWGSRSWRIAHWHREY
jgi:aryl-alcohol dehydrogenase-like predicted oxidoreductase